MPTNSSLLTITLHSLVRTTLVFGEIKYCFYDVITEFDSVPVTLSSPRRRTVQLCPLILRLGESQRWSGQITEKKSLSPVPEIETRFPPLPSSLHRLRYSGTHSLLCNLPGFIPCLGRASCSPVMIWQQLSMEWGFRITYTMRLPLQ